MTALLKDIDWASIIQALDVCIPAAAVVLIFTFLCLKHVRKNSLKMPVFAIGTCFGLGLLLDKTHPNISLTLYAVAVIMMAGCTIMEYIIPARHKRTANKKRRAKK